MARGPRAKQIAPIKRTTAVQYSTPAEMFVPGWDDLPGAAQKMARNDERAKMGQKMTPIGRGTLRPSR